MAFRLFRFCSGMAVIGLSGGLYLWLGYGYAGYWLHIKIALVLLLIVYWAMGYVWLRQMMRGEFRHSSIFFRVYNEISVLLFTPIIILAVQKYS